MAAKGKAKAKSKRESETWAKRVERFHEYLRDGNRGSGWYLAKQRITPSTLAKDLAELLKDPNSSIKFRSLELAIKLWGMMPAERREVSGLDGGPIQSEAQLAISAGPGIRSIIERLESSGIAGPGPEDNA